MSVQAFFRFRWLILMSGIMVFSGVSMVGNAAAQEPAYYIGGSVGRSFVEEDFFTPAGRFEFDDEAAAYRVFAGYRPFRYFAVEGGWRDFGSLEDTIAGTPVDADVTVWDLFGMIYMGFGPVDAFGKYGIGFWDTEFSFDGVELSDNGEAFFWGIGIALRLGRFQPRLEWEQLETDFPDRPGVLSLGLTFMF